MRAALAHLAGAGAALACCAASCSKADAPAPWPGTFRLSPGNATGQDEDPALLIAADGSLSAAFYSNRNGPQASGREDKEIFLVRAPDRGRPFGDPLQLTRSAEWSFYPSLAQDAAGVVHLAFWRMVLLPAGCDPTSTCTGTNNKVLYKSSPDGVRWAPDEETVVGGGPGDWLPSIVYDRVRDRLLVYFAAVARNAAGAVELSQRTNHLYVAIRANGAWAAPVGLGGIASDALHDTFPHVVQRQDGSFLMAFTRYDAKAPADALQVVRERTTETWISTSSDGLSWQPPTQASSITGSSIDVFPWLFADHDGRWFATWRTTLTAEAGSQVEAPIDAMPVGALTPRPELGGYSARVLPTARRGAFWGAWVSGSDPTQKIDAVFFDR